MILVFSGTGEGNILINKLLGEGFEVLASFSSKIGRESISGTFSGSGKLKINDRKLKLEDMLDLIGKYNINCIIDATHPFAVEVSKNAMEASSRKDIRYIRFEREDYTEKKSKNIIYFNQFEQAKEFLEKTKGNVFFTIGVKNIGMYRDIYTDKERRSYIKILPTPDSINKCRQAGVEVYQIQASYKNWGKDMLKSFIRENDINIVVTKQSGKSGGEIEKIKAAKETGIMLLIIKKPVIDYPEITHDAGAVIGKIKDLKS